MTRMWSRRLTSSLACTPLNTLSQLRPAVRRRRRSRKWRPSGQTYKGVFPPRLPSSHTKASPPPPSTSSSPSGASKVGHASTPAAASRPPRENADGNGRSREGRSASIFDAQVIGHLIYSLSRLVRRSRRRGTRYSRFRRPRRRTRARSSPHESGKGRIPRRSTA